MIALQPCSLSKQHRQCLNLTKRGMLNDITRQKFFVWESQILAYVRFCTLLKFQYFASHRKIITFRVGRKRRNVHMISLTFLVAACIATINKVFCTKYASISPNCCIWSLIHKVHYCLPFSRVWALMNGEIMCHCTFDHKRTSLPLVLIYCSVLVYK